MEMTKDKWIEILWLHGNRLHTELKYDNFYVQTQI